MNLEDDSLYQERKIIIFIVIIFALGMGIVHMKKQVPQIKQLLTIPTNIQTIQQHNPVAKININTADQQTLCNLSGIGPTIAQRIIQYRQEHGSFQVPNDLIKVKGIGEKKLAKIKKYLVWP